MHDGALGIARCKGITVILDYAYMLTHRRLNPLEILYNEIDEDNVNMFHAMSYRKAWCNLAKLEDKLSHTTPEIDTSKPPIATTSSCQIHNVLE